MTKPMIIAATMAALYASNGLSGMPSIDYLPGAKALPPHKKKTGALKQKRRKKK